MGFPLSINCEGWVGATRIALSYSGYWLFPSCGTSVSFSGGHCITVSQVQQEDCGKGHTTVIRLYGLDYNNQANIV